MGNNSKQQSGGRQMTGQKSTAQRLNQAINANFIKVETVHVGMKSHMVRDNNGLPVEEPERVIREFDDKMAEITAMLNRYKGEVEHAQDAPERLQPRASTAPPGPRSKKVVHQGPTEADAYLSQKVQKRVASVAPGAPRGLNIKVHTYRTDPFKRAELEGRCKRHQQALEEEQAKRKAASQGTQNFVQANQYWLHHNPEPTLIQVSALPQLIHLDEPELERPLAPSFSVAHPKSPFRQVNSGVSFTLPTRPHSASTGQALRPSASSLHSTAVFVPSGRIQLVLGAVRNRSMKGRASLGGAKSFISQQSISAPRASEALSHGLSIRPSRAVTPQMLMPPASFMASRPSSALPSPHSPPRAHSPPARAARKTSPATSGDEAGYDSAGSRSRGRSLSPEARVLLREARLAITARPASGGSPTNRPDFLAARQQYFTQKAELAEEVRIRHEELQEQRAQRAQALMEARIQREQQDAAHREAVSAYQDLVDRHAAWSAITCLNFKLAFLKQEILEARKVAPLRALRKEAAVKIASWYKRVLEARHMKSMMELAKRVSTLLKDHIPAKRQQVRQACAERLAHFLKLCSAGGATTAVVAQQQFRRRLQLIQSAWRTAAMVRKTQRAILYVYFTRFERWVVSRNTKEGRQSAHPSRHSGRQASRLISSLTGDGDGEGHSSHAGAISVKSRKAAEVEDPILEAVLATHKTMLPKEVRVEVVEKAIKDLRRKFQLQMSAYRAAMQLYNLQLPMEELRIRLLEDAGLEARPNLKKPVHPVMLVLLPKPALKRLLQDGIRVVEERKIAAQQERRLLAEKLWLEAQATKQQQLGSRSKSMMPQAGAAVQDGTQELDDAMAQEEQEEGAALADSQEHVREEAVQAGRPRDPDTPARSNAELPGQVEMDLDRLASSPELSFRLLHEAGGAGQDDSGLMLDRFMQQQEEPPLVGRFASLSETQPASSSKKTKANRLVR